MPAEQSSAVRQATPPATGYRHYNPVSVELHLDNTVAAVTLALVVLLLLRILTKMHARQQQLIDRLLATGQPPAES